MKSKIFFIIIIPFLIVNCKSKYKPKDFSFEIIDSVDSYNSESGTFTRKSVTEKFADTTVIEKLANQEFEKIYQIFVEHDFASLPDNFECSKDPNATISYIIPSFTTTIIIKSDGFTKKIQYNSGCSPKLELKAEDRFNKIHKELKKKIYNKPKIKDVPKSKLIFL